jgi:DNA mismatch repair protein MutS2
MPSAGRHTPALVKVIEGTYYEKAILLLINEVIDETGNVKDTASAELQSIRINLYRKRNDLRRVFERIMAIEQKRLPGRY